MKIRNNPQLKLSENLLMLERGRDELLLADCAGLRPLYVRKGRRYVADFLKAVSDLGSYEKIADVFPNDTELLCALLDRKIIVPDGLRKDDDSQVNSPVRPDFENRKNTSLYLLLSQSCNMGCVYCLNGAKTYRKDKNLLMNQEVAFRSIERSLDSIASHGCLEIIFFGGEPLLNWPLAKEIMAYCENTLKAEHPDKRIKYHLTSNLTVMPSDLISWAKRYSMTFLCDIDGPEPVHNKCRPFKGGGASHEAIVHNIRRLADAGLSVSLRATLTSVNQDFLLRTAEHHKAIGGSSCAFIPVNPVNSDKDILDEKLLPSPRKIIRGLTEVYRSRVWKPEELYPFNQYASRLVQGARMCLGCGAPYGNTPVVDVNGDVYACIYLVGIRKFHMGNIMNGSYPDTSLLEWMCDYLHVDRTEDCRSCPWRYLCGGGCPVGRLTVLDNPLVTRKVAAYCERIRCEYTKKLMELVLWDMAQESASSLLERQKAVEAADTAVHC